MLTDEFLNDHAERINQITKFADTLGDGAASLGTIFLLALDEGEFAIVKAGGNGAREVLAEMQERFVAAGIATD